MPVVRWIGLLLVGLVPATGAAQETGGFSVLRGRDTVAVEEFSRGPVELTGTLMRGGTTTGDRVRYRAVLVEDESAPLIELSVWQRDDPERARARQTSRVIFKDDSVAVDDMTGSGLRTLVMPTQPAPIPYLKLSIAFLEQATRRAAASPGRDSVPMPFFSLDGGQTVVGRVRRLGGDSAVVALGTVEFRLRVDGSGRILGGALPAQGLRIVRHGAS
ncbi:MAG: hypothetical protein ABI587_13640 [Gemmatimonadales bacterium]